MSDPTPPPPPGDHRAAKADAKAAKAHAKAMRPWYKKKRFMIPMILVVIVGLAIAAGSGGDDDADVASNDPSTEEKSDGAVSGGGDASEMDDVAVESCEVGDLDYIEMKLKVTNNSSKRSTYFIDTVIEGPDGAQIDSGFASVDNLEAGQSTVTDAALMTENPGTTFSCRVVEVERMSDE